MRKNFLDEKINGVNSVVLSKVEGVVLYNPEKTKVMAHRSEERRLLGFYQYELERVNPAIIYALGGFKGNVGVFVDGELKFRGTEEIKKFFCLNFSVVARMYELGQERFIPEIMGDWMTKVVPLHSVVPTSITLQSLRALILHRSSQLMLSKKGARSWSEIKNKIKSFADKFNIDILDNFNRIMLAPFVKEFSSAMLESDISYALKLLMTVTDYEPAKLENLAVAVTIVVMGSDFVSMLKRDFAKKPIGIVANNPEFAANFILALLDLQATESLRTPVKNVNVPAGPLQKYFTTAWRRVTGQLKFQPASNISVGDLTGDAAVALTLEAEAKGGIVNVALFDEVSNNVSLTRFNALISGNKVEACDRIFGKQSLKSGMSFVFVGENTSCFDKPEFDDIKFNLFQLGETIPQDIFVDLESERLQTADKVLLLTFLVMLGVEVINAESPDVEVAKPSDLKLFLDSCCEKVSVRTGEYFTADNSVPIKTLNMALKQYCGTDKVKITGKYLEVKGYEIKDTKSSPVYKHYLSLGYLKEELLSPRSGGNHCLGLRLKSKEEVIAAGKLQRAMDKNVKLSEPNYIQFFYEHFESLLGKYKW